MNRRRNNLTLIPAEALTAMWTAYKDEGDQSARQQLILHYQPLVDVVAKRIGVTLPSHIDGEDLASYGLFGLLDAIEKFDLARGIKFETYASTRIHGAIIDELRSIDNVPRSVRSTLRTISQVSQELARTLQREPTDDEIADTIGISIDDLHKQKAHQVYVHVMALDAQVDPNAESDYSISHQISDMRSQTPSGAYESEEVKAAMAKAVANLPEREAVVLSLYYYEGLTLAEIGLVLHVTESRVCQMHTRAMSAVRNHLAVA